jgi:hypothetical protein
LPLLVKSAMPSITECDGRLTIAWVKLLAMGHPFAPALALVVTPYVYKIQIMSVK